MVRTLEEKTQQPDAGCVAVVGGGGDLVAALEALGKTQSISMHPRGGGDVGATLELLVMARLRTAASENNHRFNACALKVLRICALHFESALHHHLCDHHRSVII